MDELAPHVTVIELAGRSPLPSRVRGAFEDALVNRGLMDPRVHEVDGFSGRKHRLFLNNLIAAMEQPRYLEIGIFRGATFCAAVSNNKLRATGVDNWSEFGGSANEFYANLAIFKGPDASVNIIEQDFRAVNYAALGPFNLGFYDGPHTARDQYDGARIVIEAMDANSVLLVDDWNWEQVRDGTMSAIYDTGAHIDFAIDVRTSFDNSVPAHAYGGSDWNNGLFAAVIAR
jgi:methyltransferase family protein